MTAPGATDPATPLAGLRRFLERRPPPPPGSVCDLCNAPLDQGHAHVVDIDAQALRCSCRACWLLFTNEAAAGGRWRAVPETYRLVAIDLDEAAWEALQIPVGLAFFFVATPVGRTVCLYPGPAGATESLLSLASWDRLVGATPDLAGMAPDVEALLVRRAAPGRFACYRVPIDACYELVGLVRASWRGLDGGQEAREAIEAFFDRVHRRCQGGRPG